MFVLKNSLGHIRRVLAHVIGGSTNASAEEIEDLFATHLPILMGLARLFEIRRVLEFGCGQYSTLAFLDRAAFPDLVALHSLEDNRSWVRRVKGMTHKDPRVNIRTVGKPMSSVVADVQFQNYDLVFIDDSTEYAARAETIRNVSRNYDSANIIVIHDYEAEIYRKAASAFPNNFAFTALVPNTGIVWSDVSVKVHQLTELNALVEKHAGSLKPWDIAGWTNVLNDCYANR